MIARMKQLNSLICCVTTVLLLHCSAIDLLAQRGYHRVHPFAWSASASSAQSKGTGSSGSLLSGQSSTLLPDGRVVLIGGEEQNRPIATILLEDPSTGAVKQLSSGLLKARYGHTATVLPNGMILIFGGIGSNGTIEPQAELLDPLDFSSRAISTPGLTPRASHTATLLTDGRVLIAGGVSNSTRIIPELELWDYRTSIASPAGPLRFPRESHTAVLEADGTVILSGGFDADHKPLANYEVFYPSNQSTQVLLNTPPNMNTLTAAVAASSPDDGAEDVSLAPLIAIRFTKLLSVATVNATTVTLRTADTDVPINVVAAENGRLAFITPGVSLKEGTNYTLTISGASDASGTPLPYTTIHFATKGAPKVAEAIAPAVAPTQPDPFNSPARKLPPLEARKGVTAVSGQVLQLNGDPLLNTTLQIGDVVAHTDNTGRFLLPNVSSGHQVMWIDGSTAKNRGLSYGIYEDGVDIEAKKTNVLTYTIWMTALDKSNEVALASPTDREIIVSTPVVPGLELHLPAGTVIRDRNGEVVTKVGITQIPVNQPPFPLPKGRVPVYFTIQPGGAYLENYGRTEQSIGARLFYPNTFGQPPNTIYNFWNYDADSKGWYIYGQGFVTADAKQIVPNPGVVIYEFTGAMAFNGPGTTTGGNPGNGGGGGGNGGGGGGGKGGDPVDLQTGLFEYTRTDLALPDVIPIALTRTYRQMDPESHAFGIGTMSNYDIYLVGDSGPYTYLDLILPTGGRIHFDRISSGTSYGDAVYENVLASTPYYGSQITWNGTGWTLRMKNGTTLYFPEAFGASDYLQAALVGLTDRNGNALTLARDSSHNLTQVTSPNGRWIHYTYDTSNRVTQASDNTGRTVYYTYDSGGRLSTIKDANGGITTLGYDTKSNMTTVQDARNNTVLTNYYDSNNMVWKQVAADGATYLFSYNQNQVPVSSTYVVSGLTNSEADVTDPRGNIRKVYFDSSGFLSSEIRAFGKPEQQMITYSRQSGSGLLLAITDGLNRTTSFAYDSLGNLTSITRLSGTASAATTSFEYDPPFSRLASVTDAAGRTVAFQHDSVGNLIAVTKADSTSTSLSHNPAGQLLSATDAAGNATQWAYSGADLTGVTDPLQRVSSLFVDEAGRTTSMTNPLGQNIQVGFDALNQITSMVDPLGNTSSFGHDPDGNVSGIRDAKNTTTPVNVSFDNMNRVQAQTDPLGNADSSMYDPNGNLIRYTDRRGKITSYQYDALDRLTFVGYGTQSGPTYESTASYTWDAGNRLVQAVDSIAGTTTLGYDDLDHLTSVASPQGSISYTYDAIGRRQTMTVIGQPQITYSYDDDNRITQIAQGNSAVQFGYDSLGRRATTLLPNGVLTSYAYDAASQLTGITYTKDGFQLGDLEYSYDGAGRRTQVSGSFAKTVLPQPVTGNVYNAANQLTQSGGIPVSYDLNGNLVNDGLHTYTWNARNQLISIDSGGAATYSYDAFGRRAIKNIPGVAITAFLYDGWNPVQEISGETPTANILTGGLDEYFTRTDGSGTSSMLTDVLGSTVALTDSNGAVQTQYSYDPFGSTTQSGTSSTNTIGFAGRELDAAGLYYSRARYYSPVLQRFISQDPIGIAGGMNLYAYSGNDPVGSIDPSGLDPSGGCSDCDKIKDAVNNLAQDVWKGYKWALNGLGGGVGGAEHAAEGEAERLLETEAAEKLPTLSPDIAETFSGGQYTATVLKEDMVAYRYSGGVSSPVGRFLTNADTVAQISSPQSASIALNLPEGATAQTLNTLTIPAGTTVYTGGIAGGATSATQIFVSDPSVLILH